MKTSTILWAVVGLVVLGGITWSGITYPKSIQPLGSSAGATFNSAKIAQQTITVATDTIFAVQNTDASDRSITNVDAFLTGGAATSSANNVLCATSSVATGLNGNTNYIFSNSFNAAGNIYGTTTGGSNIFVSTSSPGLVSTTTTSGSPPSAWANNYVRTWKAGSYLVCKLTSTGNNVFDASMTGFLSFGYRGT